MNYENLFGGANLTDYQTVEILFEGGEMEALQHPQFIGIIGDFLFVETDTKYMAIKRDDLYKITLQK